jgi:hypothetical protein
MKKSFFLLTFLSVFIIFNACKNEKQEEKVETSSNTNSLNPNGDSELAILMRTMHDFSKQAKTALENGAEIPTYPAQLKNMNQAKPTEGMIDNPIVFQGFSSHYLSVLDSIYLDGVSQKLQYNQMVTACITCHNEYCQGPIPAIKKLYIPN